MATPSTFFGDVNFSPFMIPTTSDTSASGPHTETDPPLNHEGPHDFRDRHTTNTIDLGSGKRSPLGLYPSPPSSTSPGFRISLPGTDITHSPDRSTTSTATASPNHESNDLPRLFPSFTAFGGILDSPVLLHHAGLKAPMPLSPPPTEPTSTLNLPSFDNDSPHTFNPEGPHYRPPTTATTLPLLSPVAAFSSPLKLSPIEMGRPTTGSNIITSEISLLSPLSPEWGTDFIAGDAPASQSLAFVPTHHEDAALDDLGLDDEEDGSSFTGFAPGGSGLRPILSLLDIPSSSYHPAASGSYIPSATSSLWAAEPSPSPSPSVPPELEEEGSQEGGGLVTSPPSAGAPETPRSALFTALPLPIDEDGDEALLPIDEEDEEPIFEKDDPAEFDKHYNATNLDNRHPYFPHPSSPSISTLALSPEFEDNEDYDMSYVSPNAPYLRSFSSLPDLDLDLDLPLQDIDYTAISHPSRHPDAEVEHLFVTSPTSHAENSNENFDFSLFSSPSPSSSDNGLLLLLDEDPDDYARPPRSPSPDTIPENLSFDLDSPALDLAIANLAEGEDLRRLSELRKRAQVAEKAARRREAEAVAEIERRSVGRVGTPGSSASSPSSRSSTPPSFSLLTDERDASKGEEDAVKPEDSPISPQLSTLELQRAAAEARKVAKKERRKAKEVTALLKLKLNEREMDFDPTSRRASISLSSTGPMNHPNSSNEYATPNLTDSTVSPPLRPSINFATSPPVFTTSKAKKKRGTPGSIDHLVAKMIHSRNEASSSSNNRVSSPSKFRPLWFQPLFASTSPPTSSVGLKERQIYLPYQQKYKFLRSSPLARMSITASPASRANSLDVKSNSLLSTTTSRSNSLDSNYSNSSTTFGSEWGSDMDTDCDEEEERNAKDAEGNAMDIDWGEEDEDVAMGFEALKTPLNWGMELMEDGSGSGLLPAL